MRFCPPSLKSIEKFSFILLLFRISPDYALGYESERYDIYGPTLIRLHKKFALLIDSF